MIEVRGEVGLNANTLPASSSAMHSLRVGQAIRVSGVPGPKGGIRGSIGGGSVSITIAAEAVRAIGLKVTASPLTVTSVHWLTAGHATSVGLLFWGLVSVSSTFDAGSKVTAPALSSDVHAALEGQAMFGEPLSALSATRDGGRGVEGLNVTS